MRMFDLVAPGAALGIGALPSLADGDHPRELTQEWVRSIYEDDPAGVHVDGMRYRTGYEGGLALALWDSAGRVAVSPSTDGAPADHALRDPRILLRIEEPLARRHITTRVIASAECSLC